MVVASDDVDRAAEAPREGVLAAAGEAGMQGLEMREHPPEKFFGQRAVAGFVGVAEIVARGRRRPAQCPQRRDPQPERVAHIVQPERVADLGEEHRHDVAPRREGAGLFVGTGLARELRHEISRNQFDELAQNRSLRTARLLWLFLFFIPALWQVSKNQSTEPLLLAQISHPCGMAVNQIQETRAAFGNEGRFFHAPNSISFCKAGTWSNDCRTRSQKLYGTTCR